MKASYINKGVIYYKKGKFYDRNMKKDLFYFDIHCPFSIFLSREKGHFSRLSWKPLNYCRQGRCFSCIQKAPRIWTKWPNVSNYKKRDRFLPSVSWLPRISYKASIFTLYVACFTNKDIMFSLIITVTVLLIPTLTQGKITDVQCTFLIFRGQVCLFSISIPHKYFTLGQCHEI